ncbi:MAG TPA: serine/threonine-protein kinase [Streptosporangiaceae bacterium]
MTDRPEQDGLSPAAPETGEPAAVTDEFAAVAPEPVPELAPESAPDLDAEATAGEAGAVAVTAVDLAQAVTSQEQQRPNGTQLSKRYRLTERIAAGGMGEVWRGVDELLGRPVAVKLMAATHANDEQFRARFRAEARYAASLSHRGIARVFDFGESEQEPPDAAGRPDGLPRAPGLAYLVMELVAGEPLSVAIARDGARSVDAALDLIEQSARALQAAHTAGIVHRDIKPGNMLITPDGQVKITDFGIARALVASHLTQSGVVMGTAQYVSPEQASGRPVTAASDLYSLGVVAYECLAGRPPFTAETPIALALAHVSNRPPPLPDSVPPLVAALVGQMLAKDPADRPASAKVVADRARALRDGQVADDSPAVPAELAGPASWFAATNQTGPLPDPLDTSSLSLAAGRGSRVRRSVMLGLIVVAVFGILTAGTVALISFTRHPAATGGTTGPTGATSSHQTGASRHPGAQRSYIAVGTVGPRLATTPAKTTRPASPSPTGSGTPSPSPSGTPDPSGTPTASPTSTSTATPTPTGTESSSPPPTQPARQPGTNQTQDG